MRSGMKNGCFAHITQKPVQNPEKHLRCSFSAKKKLTDFSCYCKKAPQQMVLNRLLSPPLHTARVHSTKQRECRITFSTFFKWNNLLSEYTQLLIKAQPSTLLIKLIFDTIVPILGCTTDCSGTDHINQTSQRL